MEIFHSLKSLEIDVTSQGSIFDDLVRLLSNLSSLRSLVVEGQSVQLAFVEAQRWEACLPRSLISFRFDLMVIQLDDLDPRALLEAFQSPFWLSRRWFVQCSLRDQGRYARLCTVHSPPARSLYWPDDEVLLASTPTTLVYPRVVDLYLWWNVARAVGGRCPRLRTLHLHGITLNPDEDIHPEILELLRTPSLKHLVIEENSPLSQRRFISLLSQCSETVDQFTCSTAWLRPILDQKHYQRLSLLLALRLRHLTLRGVGLDLVAFSRTFLNLESLTLELSSLPDLLFLLHTLQRLTTLDVDFVLPPADLSVVETNLTDVLVQQLSSSRWLIWLGGRLRSSFNVYFQSLE